MVSAYLAMWGLPNPNARQLLFVTAVLTVIGCIVAFRRPVFDKASIIVQSALLLLGEFAVYSFYINFRQPFHWANHLLPALTIAAIVYGVFLAVKKRPMRGMIILILPIHLFAMAPDPMFSLNIQPHLEWMNVFVGHIWVHFLPGRLTGWLVVAALSTGLFAFALARWVRRQGSSISS